MSGPNGFLGDWPSKTRHRGRDRVGACAGAILLVGALILASGGCDSAETGRPVVLDAREGAGARCSIAAEANRVAVAYTGPPTTWGAYLARSDDGGASFRDSQLVAPDAIASAVVVAGERIFVAFHGAAHPAVVSVARSDDWGETFAVHTFPADGENLNASIAVGGDTVALTYLRMGANASELFFVRSIDRGETWTAPVAVASGVTAHGTSLATVPGAILSSFYDYGSHRAKVARSTDDGLTWTLTSGQDPFLEVTGELVAAGDRLFVPLVDQAGSLFVGDSEDAGATWTRRAFDVPGAFGQPLEGNVSTVSSVEGIRVALAGTTMYALFRDHEHPTKVGFARSTDRGASWPPPDVATVASTDLFAKPTVDGGFAFAMDGARRIVVVAFADPAGVRVLRSLDDGAIWR